METELLYFMSYGIRCLSIVPGVWLSHKYPPKMYFIFRIALVGSLLVALSHLAVSFSQSPSVIILFYGVIFGLSSGVSVLSN